MANDGDHTEDRCAEGAYVGVAPGQDRMGAEVETGDRPYTEGTVGAAYRPAEGAAGVGDPIPVTFGRAPGQLVAGRLGDRWLTEPVPRVGTAGAVAPALPA